VSFRFSKPLWLGGKSRRFESEQPRPIRADSSEVWLHWRRDRLCATVAGHLEYFLAIV